jgi:hypothetical protein
MASALDASVTLEDVFAVVSAKRVPLAPELAGYLILEIVDGADPAGGAIDPKSVFIGDEGTVALVRPRKDAASSEDAESSARALLARLLEASGSQTPALAATAKRRSGGGLRALASEVESALIPVNRSAGRRALARLAREVKRVTQGVGRNATSAAPPRREDPKPEPAPASTRSDEPRGDTGVEGFEDEAKTRAKVTKDGPRVARPQPPALRRASASLPRTPPPPAAANASDADSADAVIAALGEPTPPPAAPEASTAAPDVAPPAAPRGMLPKVQPPKPRTLTPMPGKASAVLEEPEKTKDSLFAGDEVDSLLATFEVSSLKDDKGVSRDLKELVGLDPTPPPPEAKDLAKLVESVVGKKAAEGGSSLGSEPLDLPSPADETGHRSESLDPDAGLDELLGLGAEDETPGLPRPDPEGDALTAPLERDHERGASTVPAPSARLESKVELAPKRLPAVMGARSEPAKAASPAVAPASLPGPSAASNDGPRLPPEPAFEQPRAPKTSFALAAIALIVLVAGAGAVYKFRPDFFGGKGKGPDTSPSASTAPSSSAAPVAKCKATVVATDVPPGAEVLWRVGQAPTDVERMPVGRLEFVATAEGHAPKRAVVPAGASWDTGADGKPRFELAVQLDPAKKPGVVEPWPPGEPGTSVGGNGAPGTVHLVTTPRGAEVWLLVGLGPEARVERLKCESEVDVLVAGPGAFRKRLHASADDIAKAPLDDTQTRVIRLSAKDGTK